MIIKKLLFTISILLGTNLSFAQSEKNDPENIILNYHKDGNTTITYKDELSKNPDSLNQIFLSETEENYSLKKDSVFIKQNIIGEWLFRNAVRTNNKESNFSTPESYEFKNDGTFSLIYSKDTSYGIWTIDTTENSTIRLDYNIPFLSVKDTNILKYLDSTSLKSLTLSNESITLNKLDKNHMTILSSTIENNQEGKNEIYYRIVFLNYFRNRN